PYLISSIHPPLLSVLFHFFFCNDTATTALYTLSLHDALPICRKGRPTKVDDSSRHRMGARLFCCRGRYCHRPAMAGLLRLRFHRDRKSTRLNSSHVSISYAVFCLKKKNTILMRR